MEENDYLIDNNHSTQEIIINELPEQKLSIEKTPKFFSYKEKEIKSKYCKICEKTFSTMGNLRNHIMTIHQNLKPYKCPFPGCKKQYSIQSRLQVHYRIHIGKKPYICSFCSKGFNEKGNLKTHERFHSEKRPFKCNLCSKTYKTNGHLKDHIEIQHKKIRKFNCEICGKNFGRISTLKSHIKTHTGEKNYKCKIDGCNKFFTEKGNMIIHYKRHLKRLNNVTNLKNDCEVNNIITRPSSNFTLNNMNNTNNKKVFSSFNNQLNNNNINNRNNLIQNNDTCIENIYNNNNNFINYERGNNNYPNNVNINNHDKDINYLDSLQDINFETEKVFEVNLEN